VPRVSANGFSASLDPDLARDSAAAGACACACAVVGVNGDAVPLSRSRDYCARLTRAKARNFYYGLKLLPEPKRSDMFALYAYMRLIDDIADGDDEDVYRDATVPRLEDAAARTPEQRARDLEAWRVVTGAVLGGDARFAAAAGHEAWPAFADMARRHRLPHALFDDVIAGQQQDLRPAAFETFGQLHEYCYRVAGTVGLASIHVWGFTGGDDTRQLAVDRGVAFQLTNILRDLREDAARGRTYLPREDLAAAGLTPDDLRAGRPDARFVELMRGQVARAESYYDRSAALESRISPDSRPTLTAMTAIYRGLLKKLAADPERVLRERVSLSLFTKVLIGWRARRGR
jgi:phytoene synthase